MSEPTPTLPEEPTSPTPTEDASAPASSIKPGLLALLTPHPFVPAPLRQHAHRLTASLTRFRAHYETQYPTRIGSLLTSLLLPTCHAALINTYTVTPYTLPSDLPTSALPWFTTPAYTCTSTLPPPQPSPDGKRTHYLLDAASLLPITALAPEPGMQVLDLCAAPGGKSVAIAQLLQGSGELHVNEPDRARRGRLKAVLNEYLGEQPSVSVRITGDDGSRVGGGGGGYDRVLVDAPCSSSRHMLQAANKALRSGTEKGLEDLLAWTPKRTAKCATLQKLLLLRALERVKVGGRVVYATCSIDDAENDGVVKAVVGKEWKGRAKIVRPKGEEEWPGERTKTGWIVLPDTGAGLGPLFFAVVVRTA
ncbi:S-adenosyl-L-methionine-dependent methyltransferase [Tricharina praecox]|uniref:S-adenosyl-L-methionine-dependent methyltransferase n=1 Tax=Tricharina praecox TaxID=43433 RepID=UPI00221E5C70|nr:S-adenosyl-L-methionine-dependent methyltransferase [Tricharina praecox]KAI5850756.1 S-adenosyl-L-methionine-dependent methyltransferase [Tricharina praecox]